MFKNLFVFYVLFSINFSFNLLGKELLMTQAEQKYLENFCHAMMWSSQMGYVLYGDKPICVEGYSKTLPNNVFQVGSHLQSAIGIGIQVWKKLQLPLESSQFALIDQSIDHEGSLILFLIDILPLLKEGDSWSSQTKFLIHSKWPLVAQVGLTFAPQA
jgi:hypothetical protein